MSAKRSRFGTLEVEFTNGAPNDFSMDSTRRVLTARIELPR
jgi:hypothetical protein